MLHRILDFWPFRKRSFGGAGRERRRTGVKRMVSLNQTILAEGTFAAQQAAYQARNSPWVNAGVNALVTRIVGTGITPRSSHPDPKVRERLHKLWREWVKRSDPRGRCDFYGQQALAVRRMIEGGEALGRLRIARPGDGLTVPLHVETIDRTQLPLDLFRNLGNGTVVRAGIEYDDRGVPTAYHLLKTRPDDPFSVTLGITGETVRVEARDMLHLFQPLEDGQLRGATWLAPVIPTVQDLDELKDATLQRSKVANLLVGFIRDMAGTAGQLGSNEEGEDGEEEVQIKLTPGGMIRLPSGTDISFTDLPEFKDYGPFTKTHLRGVAAGAGVPYPELAADYEGVTFSSARVELMAFKARVEAVQFLVVIPQFCQPTWERFVTLAVLTGALEAPDFERNAADYLSCDWLPPKFEHVDVQKDIAAEVEAINNGLKSRTQALAERGYDVEEVDRQIAADRARERELGLEFGSAPAEPPTPAPTQEDGVDGAPTQTEEAQ
ncbi:phage portal protein [Azospirillum sp. sgz301742]